MLNENMISKNQRVTLQITGMSSQGSGVGRYGGAAVFVPQTAVGDVVRAQIVKVAKSFCYGKLLEVFTPSPDRLARVDCPVFAECGVSVYDERSHTGLLRHIYLREAGESGEFMACAVVNARKIEALPGRPRLIALLREALPNLKSVTVNFNHEKTNVILGRRCETVWGADFITDTLCGVKLRLSPLSFYQVNHVEAQRLYARAAEYAALKPDDVLLDLYCGAGAIGLSMAKSCKRVIGVELSPEAVADARQNAAINNITNARFLCGDTALAAGHILKEGITPAVVVLDPPRKGLTPELIETVASIKPGRVVYISCNPATMARDLTLFAGHGFAATQITPVDMFPRTAHVETIVLLQRQNT
ncbi:MAG: 23S rRNA (uracil(1939)-C(5))-methyltransferase RlmD [Oscillospiraceae bacterium]|jgi:23S rRNA (uracil1939-C5)-methyltransferase|nr:23S rRNA (uracil(1939)-C(5))-methyltransferase RlmD [Oscillospiraceae bacterium]